MKLSIRDLLWLTLVVAVALAWYRAERSRVVEVREANARRIVAVEEWKSNIAESIVRFKEVVIDPIQEENKLVVGQPISADKLKYLQAHNEIMGHLRMVGAASRSTASGPPRAVRASP
jgi:hypothetical protein